MPCALSPSAIALTSSGCSLQNSAIWSNDNAVLSSSQTAVAFGISGAAVAMVRSLLAPWRQSSCKKANLFRAPPTLSGEAPAINDDRESGRNIGTWALWCNAFA
jgi:hypothetical protein